ncbi:TniQ family protein [Paenibacillus sp. CMM36]
MFTVRLKPQIGEGLTSFMRRFAVANGSELLTLWNFIKSKHWETPQRFDLHLIDYSPMSILNINLLSNLTKVPVESLLEMTFYYVLKKYCHSKKIMHSRFINGMIRTSLYYCPYCLNEKYYIPLKWKIDGVDSCLKHQCILLNHCNRCGGDIELSIFQTSNCCSCCHENLGSGGIGTAKNIEHNHYQRWLSKAWDELLTRSNYFLSSDLVVQKLIYILNDENSTYDPVALSRICDLHGIHFQGLLQYARNTQKQHRNLHVKKILEILYLKNKLPSSLLNIELPPQFLGGLLNNDGRKRTEPHCLAPWCVSFQKSGSLVKTGTDYKKLKSGQVLRNHLACFECGCEYAFNNRGEQIEKYYFIQGYSGITNGHSLTELSKEIRLSISKCRRIIAYFRSRTLDKHVNVKIESSFIERVTTAIRDNIGFSEIEKWECWESNDHFLIYRYHIKVMREKLCQKKKGNAKISREKIIVELEAIVDELLEINEDITIRGISKRIGISQNTIRKWKVAHDRIKEAKIFQQKKRLDKKVAALFDIINSYCQEHAGEAILSKDIYDFIGIKQSYLLSIAPEVSKYISYKLRMDT